jgi:putative nucleotidyltransferase with HDIG domain
MLRILFVDDEPRVLDGLRRMLHGQRESWDMEFAPGGAAALAQLDATPFDVLVTDMRMPGMDGAALLAEVAQRWPATIRIVLSGQTDDASALRAMPFAHQYLMKPCEVATLRDVIDRTTGLRDLLAHPVLRDIAGGLESLPPVPGAYLALGKALGSSLTSIDDIAAIIERDQALTAKLLQLVNSSFFGQRREVSSVRQACALLGTGLIRNLALGHEVFAGSTWPPSSAVSLEDECNHAVSVAGVARAMQQDTADGEAAVAAGLLHDVGKLVLNTRAAAAGLEDRRLSRAEGRPLFEIEQARLGVSHAEVGAYLLGLWGLPHVVVEAVAHHHVPARLKGTPSRVLAAVHVADGLIREAQGQGGPELDPGCVNLVGGPEALERWRDLASGVAA